jgi:hypothetical protein
MSRTPSRPRRTTSNKAAKLQLRVYAEGEKTENGYLTELWRRNRDRVVLSIAEHHGSAPLTLVKIAVSERKRDLRTAKRQGSAFDEYWCVFDIDEHKNIPQALDMAAANGIKVALSSPCLELWFLIHFENRTAYLDHHEAQLISERHLSCRKVLTPTALHALSARYGQAVEHAKLLDAKHVGDNSPTPWNPSTNIWELTETILYAEVIDGSGVPFRSPIN